MGSVNTSTMVNIQKEIDLYATMNCDFYHRMCVVHCIIIDTENEFIFNNISTLNDYHICINAIAVLVTIANMTVWRSLR